MRSDANEVHKGENVGLILLEFNLKRVSPVSTPLANNASESKVFLLFGGSHAKQ